MERNSPTDITMPNLGASDFAFTTTLRGKANGIDTATFQPTSRSPGTGNPSGVTTLWGRGYHYQRNF